MGRVIIGIFPDRKQTSERGQCEPAPRSIVRRVGEIRTLLIKSGAHRPVRRCRCCCCIHAPRSVRPAAMAGAPGSYIPGREFIADSRPLRVSVAATILNMFLTSAEVTLGVGALTAGSALLGSWLTSRKDIRIRRQDSAERRNDRQEARLRENQARWAERRSEVHSQILNITGGILGYIETALGIESVKRYEQFRDDDTVPTRMVQALAQLEFIPSPAIVADAHRAYISLMDAVRKIQRALTVENEKRSELRETAVHAYGIAKAKRNEYLVNARGEVGLSDSALDDILGNMQLKDLDSLFDEPLPPPRRRNYKPSSEDLSSPSPGIVGAVWWELRHLPTSISIKRHNRKLWRTRD